MSQIHRSRRLSLQGLCCLDIQGPKVHDLVAQFIHDSDEPAGVINAAMILLDETYEDRQECDLLLARHARRWDLARLALVDRNILRQGVHELRQGQVPPKVIITEALKLAEEFSSAESPRFVNGVLDAVAKDIAHQGQGPEDAATPPE